MAIPVLKTAKLRAGLFRLEGRNYSLRKRFTLFVLSLFSVITAVMVLLLNLMGMLNPSKRWMEEMLNYQLESSSTLLENKMDSLAAYAVEFSEQMTAMLEKYLADTGLSFGALKNNADRLTTLQSYVYLNVYNNMRVADCSGIFYFFNTTVNDDLTQKHYNGLYLKVANLFSENAACNKVVLYRGAAAVAREQNINLHSTWQNEMVAGVFTQIDELAETRVESLPKAYLLTNVYELTDTWERARFLCVPILDGEGNTIGVCGFEISDLLFKLSYKTVDIQEKHMAFALMDKGKHGYRGQISGSQSGYMPLVGKCFAIDEGEHFAKIESDNVTFYGKVCDVVIGDTVHICAVMLPDSIFWRNIRQGRFIVGGILLALAAITICACQWLSKRYVSPVLKGFEQLKIDPRVRAQTCIAEIDDLFSFLTQKDNEHEEQRRLLANEKRDIESVYTKIQTNYARLIDKKTDEIDDDSFEMFCRNLKTLTKREREVFDLYLAGRNAKEIHEYLGMSENTVKFHNKNIYSKLGVSSRKQLLQFATLMKEHEMRKRGRDG